MSDNQTFYVELGRRIREARQNRSLTQEALASLVSLTRTSVTNIEKGRQQVLVHTLVDIATALKVPPEILIPQPSASPELLDQLLDGYSEKEQEWIKSVINTVGEN